MKKSLQSSEWILIGSLLAIMGSMVLIAKVNTHRAASVLAEIPEVAAATEVVVRVTGAVVEPVTVTLPVGSRICDLKTKVLLSEEAEKRFFRRRKKLKDGEIIEVPKKTVE